MAQHDIPHAFTSVPDVWGIARNTFILMGALFLPFIAGAWFAGAYPLVPILIIADAVALAWASRICKRTRNPNAIGDMLRSIFSKKVFRSDINLS